MRPIAACWCRCALKTRDLPIDVRAIHTTELDGWGENPRQRAIQDAVRGAGGKSLKLSRTEGAPPRRRERPGGRAVLDLRAAVRQHERRSGAGILQRRHHRGHHHRPGQGLGAVRRLARNTAFTFKGKHVDVAQIARQTQGQPTCSKAACAKPATRAHHGAADRRQPTSSQVWGERYDRDLNDIFALQDEISKAIVAALKLTLLPGEKQALEQRGTTNPEAYKLYLMARQFWLLDNERNNEIVVRICRRVVETRSKLRAGLGHAGAGAVEHVLAGRFRRRRGMAASRTAP